jgi:hypothetical protein
LLMISKKIYNFISMHLYYMSGIAVAVD